jgi:hypothetical protein
VVIQKPLRKLSDDGTVVIPRRSSANSWARSCCTRGLSDIQKPETDVRQLVSDGKGGPAVEQSFPQLGDLDFWESIVFGIGEEQGEVVDCLVPCFLVCEQLKVKRRREHATYRTMRDICPTVATTCLRSDRIAAVNLEVFHVTHCTMITCHGESAVVVDRAR